MTEPRKGTNAYWMGQVDSTLRELEKSIQAVSNANNEFTQELRVWCKDTENRVNAVERLACSNESRLNTINSEKQKKVSKEEERLLWWKENAVGPAVRWIVTTATAAILLKLIGLITITVNMP